MQEFRVFRAIGLSFKSLFRNFIPFVIITGVLYSPAILLIETSDPTKGSLETVLNNTFLYPLYAMAAAATLLAPMLTYRVVQELNGAKVSIVTSIKYGFRGILPALIIGIIGFVLGKIPFGGIINAVLTCIWFVAAPAAVAEKLNPIAALSRSAELTRGRRWGIFGLTFLIGLVMLAILFAYVMPLFDKSRDTVVASMKGTSLTVIITIGVFQMFNGIVQAVSYALLRADKDGMTHEQLAAVFE